MGRDSVRTLRVKLRALGFRVSGFGFRASGSYRAQGLYRKPLRTLNPASRVVAVMQGP